MLTMKWGVARLAAVALVPLVPLGCGGDDEMTAPSTTGSISILTSTSGDAGSADYLVRIDGAMERNVGPNGTVIYTDVEPGDYEVSLLSLPSGCSVEGANPRAISVAAEEIARITFTVTCITQPPTKPGDPGPAE
jgi:hypothetical protein